MIADTRQYEVTLAAIARFEAELRRADQTNAHLHPAIQAAMKASVLDQIEELRRDVQEYEYARGLIVGPVRRR